MGQGGHCSTHPPPPPPSDPFESGLNNERISLLKAAELATRLQATLVLPSYKDFHGLLRRDPPDPASGVVLPFSHFYDEAAFAKHAAKHGFKIARTMPANRFHACAKQLNFASQFSQLFTSDFIAAYASEHRVMCLPPHAVWFAMNGYDQEDLDWSANAKHAAGLAPSPLYAAQLADAEARLSTTHGTSTFIAVHVRVEADWVDVCEMGGDRSEDGHWLSGQKDKCLVTDTEIAAALAADGVKRGTLAFVMTGDDVATAAPALCGKNGFLTCFTPDDVWRPTAATPTHRTILPRAYISFLLAGRAGALYGNRHSTFSTELGSEFAEAGKKVVYYNPPCPPGEDVCA